MKAIYPVLASLLVADLAKVVAIKTCADLKTLYSAHSITNGGTGCCGNDDASLNIPECNAVKDFVQPIATQGLPVDLPSTELVKAAMEKLPTSTGIASALADYTDAYFSHPFGAALSQYVKTCRYWSYFREDPPAFLNLEKGDPVAPEFQYNEHSAMSLQRMTPDPVAKTITINAVGEYNQDLWGTKAILVTKSWYRPGWSLSANGSWVEEAGVNTWIYYFDSPPTQSRWTVDTSMAAGGFFGAENRGPTYVLETFDATTMKPIPERCTFVCMVSKIAILPFLYTGALAGGGMVDLFSKDRYVNGQNQTVFSVQDFYASVRKKTWTPADGYGAFDDTQLGSLNILLIQAGCKYMNPIESPALPRQLLTTPSEDDVTILGSNKGTGIVHPYATVPISPLIAPTAYDISKWFARVPAPTLPNAVAIVPAYSAGDWDIDVLPEYEGFEAYNRTFLDIMAADVAKDMNANECMGRVKSHYIGQTFSLTNRFYGKTNVEATEYVWKDDAVNLFPESYMPFLQERVKAAKKGDHFVYTDDVYIVEVVDSATGEFAAKRLVYADHSNMYHDKFDPFPNTEKTYALKYKCAESDNGDITLHTVSMMDDYSCFYSKDEPKPWDLGTTEEVVTGSRRQYTYWRAHTGEGISRCNSVIYTHEVFRSTDDGLKFDVTQYSIDAIEEHPKDGLVGSFNGIAKLYFDKKQKLAEVEIPPVSAVKSLIEFTKTHP